MEQDDQGRPLSDDGQWVWNGTEWEPATGGGAAPGWAGAGDGGQETLISTRPDFGVSPSGQGGYGAPSGAQQGLGAPSGAQQGFGAPHEQQGHGPAGAGFGQSAQPGGGPGAPYGSAPGYGQPGPGGQPFGAGGAGAPYGGGPYGGAPYGGVPYSGYPGGPTSGTGGGGGNRNKLIAAVVGALVVIAAVVVILILTLGGKDKKSAAVTSGSPSPAPTVASPTASPTPSVSPSGTAGPSPNAGGPASGRYVCSTSSGRQIGNFTLTDGTYQTGGGGTGVWSYDSNTNGITFTGSDLSDFTGQYDRTTGDIDLVAKDKTVSLTCSQ